MRDLDSFLRTVSPDDFPRLRTLKGSRYDHRVRPSTHDLYQAKTASLLNHFLMSLPLLESIDVSTMLNKLNIAVFNNISALRSLRLCDISESYQNQLLGDFVRPDAPSWARRRPQNPLISSAAYQTFAAFAATEFPALSLNDTNTITELCPEIEELDLGINRASEQVSRICGMLYVHLPS